MTVSEVQARIAKVRQLAWDDESAHSAEDALFLDVLAAIAKDEGDEPRELAAAALESAGVRFARWCA
jgi:hypothetical protein